MADGGRPAEVRRVAEVGREEAVEVGPLVGRQDRVDALPERRVARGDLLPRQGWPGAGTPQARARATGKRCSAARKPPSPAAARATAAGSPASAANRAAVSGAPGIRG